MNSTNNLLCSFPMRETYSKRSDVCIRENSVLLYGVFEQRSELDSDWLQLFGGENTYEIFAEFGLYSVRVPRFSDECLSLRDQAVILSFIKSLSADSIYVDITGLPHHVWMPILRVSLEAGLDTICIYVEPKSYTHSAYPKPGEFFDLSEGYTGFSPIPTFARLSARRTDETTLVPLLGFEGIRFRHLIEKIEPSERDISPVVGVPGFELEYPFHTFEGNAFVLSSTRSWQRVHFVDAACPFSLYQHLSEMQMKSEGRHYQIATIGTKPHALGAMLYAMFNPNVELLYDHPIRRQKRTKGMARCHIYRISDFLSKFGIAQYA